MNGFELWTFLGVVTNSAVGLVGVAFLLRLEHRITELETKVEERTRRR